MNKQRKVVITTTYNEMGIIIDTKAEEVAQQNLQPTCNQLATDTISRQAAIEALYSVDEYNSRSVKAIKQLPPIQPKRGKWIHHPEIGWGETWLCDQCGEKTTSTVMGKPRANFCPMCGADMREVTE